MSFDDISREFIAKPLLVEYVENTQRTGAPDYENEMDIEDSEEF